MSDKIERDEVTGVETTGHEWDGIKELNTPAPRWWLITWVVTMIWGAAYMVVYPAWPTLSGEGVRGGTEGTLGWTQYSELAASQAEIVERRADYEARFKQADYDMIRADEALFAYAQAGGASAFKDNCATCHGTGGQGGPGYPNLNDDDWLWGGDVASIEQTIRFGVRSSHDDTRISDMPPFADMLTDEQVVAVARHVLSLSGKAEADANGAVVFEEQCSFCHGVGGEGMREVGAPNLKDAIWFYGGSQNDLMRQIKAPKHGIMPHWDERLDDSTIRALTVYIHSLGGGEETEQFGR